MIHSATASAKRIEESEQISDVKRIEEPVQTLETPVQSNIQTEVKYFSDNGIQYKLENGIMYKKVWKELQTEIITDESGKISYPDFRIVNKDTLKPINNSKYIIEQLVWVELESN